MFVMPSRPSPLAQILQGFSEAAPAYLQKRREEKSSEALFNTLSQMDENVSPLEFTRLLHSNPNLLPEHRASALKSYTDIQNAQSKQTAANRPVGGSRSGNVVYDANGRPRLTAGAQSKRDEANITLAQQGKPLLRDRDINPEIAAWEDEHPDQVRRENENTAPITPFQKHREGLANAPKEELPPEQRFVPTNMTPKQLDKWHTENRKYNEKPYDAVSERVRGTTKFNTIIDSMERLNEHGELPDDANRWTINPETGDVYDTLKKLSIGATPDTELFIKDLYEMAPDAKKDYGARITDFDLKTHMKKYPSLMNTKQGRRLILNQIKMLNKITQEYDKALVGVYRRHGLANITREQAENEAEDISKKEIDKVLNQYYQSINKSEAVQKTQHNSKTAYFESLPDPLGFPEGHRLRNDKTNEILELRDGKWEKL